jgi:hypothetical protein
MCRSWKSSAPISARTPRPRTPTPRRICRRTRDRRRGRSARRSGWNGAARFGALYRGFRETREPRIDIQTALTVLGRREAWQREIEARWQGDDPAAAFPFDAPYPDPPAYPEDGSPEAHAAWWDRFEAFKAAREARNADYRAYTGYRLDLRNTDLQGYDLSGGCWRGARFEGAQMQGADLRGAQMQGADLRRADAGGGPRGAQMQGAVLGARRCRGRTSARADAGGDPRERADAGGEPRGRADAGGGPPVRADAGGGPLARADAGGGPRGRADAGGGPPRFAQMQGATSGERRCRGRTSGARRCRGRTSGTRRCRMSIWRHRVRHRDRPQTRDDARCRAEVCRFFRAFHRARAFAGHLRRWLGDAARGHGPAAALGRRDARPKDLHGTMAGVSGETGRRRRGGGRRALSRARAGARGGDPSVERGA